MSFCNLPSHAKRIEEVNKYRSREGKKPILLPLWTKGLRGEPPREMHIEIYTEGEQELKLILRPCRTCLRRLFHIYLGIKHERLVGLAPEFAATIGDAEKFITQKEVDFIRKYSATRKIVRLAVEEYMDFLREQKMGVKK